MLKTNKIQNHDFNLKHSTLLKGQLDRQKTLYNLLTFPDMEF